MHLFQCSGRASGSFQRIFMFTSFLRRRLRRSQIWGRSRADPTLSTNAPRNPPHLPLPTHPLTVCGVNTTRRDVSASGLVLRPSRARTYASLFQQQRLLLLSSIPPHPPPPRPPRAHDSERSGEAFGVGLGLLAVGSVPLESPRNKEQQSGRETIPGQILWTSNSRERWQHCQISDRTEAACLFCFGVCFFFLTPPPPQPAPPQPAPPLPPPTLYRSNWYTERI